MIRAFVAIRPPDEVCEALEELQADLPVGRAVAFENLHLTLAFLGEHPAPAVADVAGDLAAIPAAPFTLELRGLGVFGDARPRSVHAEVAPSSPLAALAAKVRHVAERAGMGERRKFVAHVTLARFQGAEAGGGALRNWLEQNAAFRSGPFEVSTFALMRSDLTRSGPVYVEMARFALQGRDATARPG